MAGYNDKETVFSISNSINGFINVALHINQSDFIKRFIFPFVGSPLYALLSRRNDIQLLMFECYLLICPGFASAGCRLDFKGALPGFLVMNKIMQIDPGGKPSHPCFSLKGFCKHEKTVPPDVGVKPVPVS